jgi:acetyl esterase/lipase
MTARLGAVLVAATILGVAFVLATPRSALAGELIGDIPADGGLALVTWSGGTTDEVVQAAALRGCALNATWSFASGFPVGFIVGAPTFVNRAYLSLHPGGNVQEGPMLLVCHRNQPVVYRDPTFEVRATEDIVYGKALVHPDWGAAESTVVDLTLDLYEPVGQNPGIARPAIVVIHGGGFSFNSSKTAVFVQTARYFASRGWVAISINDRLSGEHGTIPDGWNGSNAIYPAARDTKAAVRWLRDRAETYNVDTNRIAATGGSAGAILALMLGTVEESDFRDEISVEDDWTLGTTRLEQSSRVATIVDHWGSLSAVTDAERYSGGDSRVDGADAPVIIFHGTEDPLVPYSAGLAVVAAFSGAGIPYELHPIEGAGHSPWSTTIDGRAQNDFAFDFIAADQGLRIIE